MAEKPPPFSCVVCRKGFQHRQSKNRHQKSCDQRLRCVYTCHTCQQSFARKDAYTRHLQTHAKQRRKRRCTACKTWVLTDSWAKHMASNKHDVATCNRRPVMRPTRVRRTRGTSQRASSRCPGSQQASEHKCIPAGYEWPDACRVALSSDRSSVQITGSDVDLRCISAAQRAMFSVKSSKVGDGLGLFTLQCLPVAFQLPLAMTGRVLPPNTPPNGYGFHSPRLQVEFDTQGQLCGYMQHASDALATVQVSESLVVTTFQPLAAGTELTFNYGSSYMSSLIERNAPRIALSLAQGGLPELAAFLKWG